MVKDFNMPIFPRIGFEVRIWLPTFDYGFEQGVCDRTHEALSRGTRLAEVLALPKSLRSIAPTNLSSGANHRAWIVFGSFLTVVAQPVYDSWVLAAQTSVGCLVRSVLFGIPDGVQSLSEFCGDTECWICFRVSRPPPDHHRASNERY